MKICCKVILLFSVFKNRANVEVLILQTYSHEPSLGPSSCQPIVLKSWVHSFSQPLDEYFTSYTSSKPPTSSPHFPSQLISLLPASIWSYQMKHHPDNQEPINSLDCLPTCYERDGYASIESPSHHLYIRSCPSWWLKDIIQQFS